jgi:hypothetical protein
LARASSSAAVIKPPRIGCRVLDELRVIDTLGELGDRG